MATRYYFPSSGAAPVTPATDAGWINDDHVGSKNLVSAKSNTALTDFAGNTGAGSHCLFQYVSAPIGVVNFNGTTFSMVVRGLKTGSGSSSLTVGIRLRHSDGSFTTLFALTTEDSALGTTAATRIANAVALLNVTSQNNDRIVVEIGAGGGTSTFPTIRTGDVSATADFALTSGLTTDLDPWIEFSAAIPAPMGGDLLSFFH